MNRVKYIIVVIVISCIIPLKAWALFNPLSPDDWSDLGSDVGSGIADGAEAVGEFVTEGISISKGYTYYVYNLHKKSSCLQACEDWFYYKENCKDTCNQIDLCGTYGADRLANPWEANQYPGSQCAVLSYKANSNLLKDNKDKIEFNKACTAKDEDELKEKLAIAVTQKPYSKEKSFIVGDPSDNKYATYVTYASWAYDKMCMTGIDEYDVNEGGGKVKHLIYRSKDNEIKYNKNGWSIYDGEKSWTYDEYEPAPDDERLEVQYYNEVNKSWGNKDADGKWIPGKWNPAPDGWCTQPDRECVIKKRIEITDDITLTSPLEILNQESVGYAWPAGVEIVGKKKQGGNLPVIKLGENFKADDKAAIIIEDGEHSFVISGIKFTNVDIDFNGVSSKLVIRDGEFENTDTPLNPGRNWTLVDNLFSGSAPFINLQGDARDNLIVDNIFPDSANTDAIELNATEKNNIIIGNKYPADSSIKVSSESNIQFSSAKGILYGEGTCTSYPYCHELTFTKPNDVFIAAVELYRGGKRVALVCDPYYGDEIIKLVKSAHIAPSGENEDAKDTCDYHLSGNFKSQTKIIVSAPSDTFNTQNRADLWAQWKSNKSLELVQDNDPSGLAACKKQAAEGYYSKLGGNGDWKKYNEALEKCGMDAGWCDVWVQAETMCQDSKCNNKVTDCPQEKQYPLGVTAPDNEITAIFHSGEGKPKIDVIFGDWTPLGSPVKVLTFTPEINKEKINEQINAMAVANFKASAVAAMTALNNVVTEEGCFEKAKKAQESACEKYRCGDDSDCMAKCVLANACSEFSVYCVQDVNLESDVYKENCLAGEDTEAHPIQRDDGYKRYLPPTLGGDAIKCEGGTWNDNGDCECPAQSHLFGGACVCDDDYEKYGGLCVEKCKDGQIRDGSGQCVCPAGTVETLKGFTTSCEAPPAPPECSGDSECSDGKLCKDGTCVNPDDPTPLGGGCKTNGDCGTGMLCSSAEKCECDINNNYYPPYAGAKTCEYKEIAVGSICELNGGQYLQERCIYNKNEAACIIGGGAWEGEECINVEEPSADAGGCSCTLASRSMPTGGMPIAIAYLTMLGSILLVRLRKRA